jgi:hypothetical protein
MDTTTALGPVRMVPVVIDGPVEHVSADALLAAAHELVQRLTYLATASALPGDEAMRWHDQREECMDIVSTLGAGLVTMAVPE